MRYLRGGGGRTRDLTGGSGGQWQRRWHNHRKRPTLLQQHCCCSNSQHSLPLIACSPDAQVGEHEEAQELDGEAQEGVEQREVHQVLRP